MSEKNNYNLVILNQKFNIKSDADEKHVKKVADYVNKKINEIITKNKAISTHNVAVLAALNIADDFFRLQEKTSHQTQDWIEKIEGITAEL